MLKWHLGFTRLVLIASFLWLTPSFLFSQTAFADSLKESLVRQQGNDTAQLNTLNELVYALRNSNLNEAKGYAQQGIVLARRQDQKSKLAIFLYQVGVIHYFQGKYDSAAYYFQEALVPARAIGDSLRENIVLGTLGGLYESKNQDQKAMDHYQQSLRIALAIGDYEGVMVNHTNMGKVHEKLENEKEAIYHYRESIRIGRTYKQERMLGDAYNNLGITLKANPDTALYYLQLAKSLFEKFGNNLARANTLNNMGGRYEDKNDAQQARLYFKEGFQAFQEVGFLYGKASAATNLGGNYLSTGELEQAFFWLDSARIYGEMLENYEVLDDTYRELSEAYELRGDLKQALLFRKKWSQARDSVFKLEKAAQLATNEARFQMEEQNRKLVEQDLEIARQENQRNQLIIGALLLLALISGLAIFFYQRQRARKRESELALQLKQTETQQLREMDQMKSRFFANISHEFRTPLTLILGPLNKFIAGSFEGDPTTYYHMMKRNGERLLQLINQLLDLSRLEAGRLQLKEEAIELSSFLRSLVFAFDSLAASKQISYQKAIKLERENVFLDKDKIEKVLNNLLSNALKFTPEEGEVKVYITMVGEKTGISNLYIRVQDTGPGIPAKDLPKIFDRFYQVEQSSYEGSGIGLALCKELVALMGGKIEATSEEGKGSQFEVYLPLKPASEAETLPTAPFPAIAMPPSTEASQAPESIQLPLLLLVEDHADMRKYISDELGENYRIQEAKNGKEGLKMATQLVPDLIISDVMMPEMDGLGLVQALKSQEATSHIPVILLTAKEGREAKLAGLETGAQDYLTKPFDGDELRLKVQNQVKQLHRFQEKWRSRASIPLNQVEVSSKEQIFLRKVLKLVEEYMSDESFSVEDLGREIGMSRSQLHRKLKALTGNSASVFIRTVRLTRAHDLLKQDAATAAEISYQVGFSSPSYFAKCYKDHYGFTPSDTPKE